MSISRAGLVSIILVFAAYIGLTASAPISDRFSNSVKRYDYDNALVARYFDMLLDREFDELMVHEFTKRDYLSGILDDRDLDAEDSEYTLREYDPQSTLDERDIDDGELPYSKRDDSNMLRRRGFFDSIRNAFRKVGSSIQSGFQRAGGAIKSGFQRAGGAIRSGFQRVQSGFQRAGGAMRNGFQKVGQRFKAFGNTMRNGLQRGFSKIGQGLKTAGRVIGSGLQKVGNYLKKSGAMIGKFALKVLATGATVAAKVVGFVPGIGTAVSRVLKGVAMGANMGSKAIHADLPGNLEKASEGMDYVLSPMTSLGKLAGGDKAKKAFEVMDNIF